MGGDKKRLRRADFFRELEKISKGRMKRDEPLARHSSLRIGGPADFFTAPEDLDTLLSLLKFCNLRGEPTFIMGKGTNLLFRDGGFRGVVIQMAKPFQEVKREGERILVSSGFSLPKLVRWCWDESLSGLEFAIGIPGTVGGAVVKNAGAFGKEMGEIVIEINGVSKECERERLTQSDFWFKYRKAEIPEGFIITDVLLRLKKDDPHRIGERIKKLFAKRKASQPLSLPSAGCIFKNPPQSEAGRLNDELGLKGLKFGQAQVSFKHANFIVNRGGAKARDVLQLMERILEVVEKKRGIRLEPEIEIVGEG